MTSEFDTCMFVTYTTVTFQGLEKVKRYIFQFFFSELEYAVYYGSYNEDESGCNLHLLVDVPGWDEAEFRLYFSDVHAHCGEAVSTTIVSHSSSETAHDFLRSMVEYIEHSGTPIGQRPMVGTEFDGKGSIVGEKTKWKFLFEWCTMLYKKLSDCQAQNKATE